MIGTRLSDGSFSGKILSMMKKGGIKLKTFTSSHSQYKESIKKLLGEVLGYLYNPLEDIKFVFNPAKEKSSQNKAWPYS